MGKKVDDFGALRRYHSGVRLMRASASQVLENDLCNLMILLTERAVLFSPLRCFRALGTGLDAMSALDRVGCFRRSDASERWAPPHQACKDHAEPRFRRSDASERWAHNPIGLYRCGSGRFSPLRCFRALGTRTGPLRGRCRVRFRRSDASERWAQSLNIRRLPAHKVFAAPMLPSVGHSKPICSQSPFAMFSPLRCFRALGTGWRQSASREAEAVFAAPMLPSVGHRAWALRACRVGWFSPLRCFRALGTSNSAAIFARILWFSPLRCFRALGTAVMVCSLGLSQRFSPLRCFRALGTFHRRSCRPSCPRFSPLRCFRALGTAMSGRSGPTQRESFRRSDASERWARKTAEAARAASWGFRRSDASERWARDLIRSFRRLLREFSPLRCFRALGTAVAP